MSILQLAIDDAGKILTNIKDFGQYFTLTDPNGFVFPELRGYCNNINLESPEIQTDQRISSEIASVVFPMQELIKLGSPLPWPVVDDDSLPWVCEFSNATNNAKTFRVMNTLPDNDLGLLTLILERWNN